MKELLLYMAKNLVDDPEAVTVTETSDEDGRFWSCMLLKATWAR